MMESGQLSKDAFCQKVIENVSVYSLTPEERAEVDIFSEARGGHGARGYGKGRHDLNIGWWVHPDRYGREAAFLYEALALRGGERLLSIGCGPALHEATIGSLYPDARVVATDLDPKEIETAKEVASRLGVTNVEHHALKAEDITSVAPARSFDRVISLAVLHDIGDLPGAVRAIREAMKDDGVFAFTFNPYRRAAIFPDAPVPEVVAEQFEILSHVPLVTPQDSHDLYGQIAATSEAKRNYALGWDAVVAVPR